MRRGARLLAWTLIACAGCAAPAMASGANAPGLVVIPRPAVADGLSYFRVDARPGERSAAGTIELLNRGRSTIVVALAAVPGETLDTLGSTYATEGSPRRGAALWLRPSRRELRIAAGASVLVPIAVAVPERARPGDYLGGVSVEAAGQSDGVRAGGRGASVATTVRYAIGVETRLPGPRRPSIRFTGASLRDEPSGLTFLLDAANLGNAILEGVHGRVSIGRGGRTLLSRSLPPGTFVTGTRIAYPVPAAGQRPSEGTRYRIRAWLRYPGGVARLDTGVVFGHRAAALQRRYRPPSAGRAGGLPSWAILALALTALYGLLVTFALVRRRSRDRTKLQLEARVEDVDRTPAGTR